MQVPPKNNKKIRSWALYIIWNTTDYRQTHLDHDLNQFTHTSLRAEIHPDLPPSVGIDCSMGKHHEGDPISARGVRGVFSRTLYGQVEVERRKKASDWRKKKKRMCPEGLRSGSGICGAFSSANGAVMRDDCHPQIASWLLRCGYDSSD